MALAERDALYDQVVTLIAMIEQTADELLREAREVRAALHDGRTDG